MRDESPEVLGALYIVLYVKHFGGRVIIIPAKQRRVTV